jgi:uncharacterized FlgJ-related protein
MLDKFKFLLFFILIAVLIAIIYFFNYEKDMSAYYQNKQLELSFEGKKEISEDKKQFIFEIVRSAQYSNYQIIEEQKLLKKANKSFHKTSAISKFQRIKLQKIVDKYKMEQNLEELETAELASVFDELRKRVAIVPIRLSIAQAITESAWGDARFAKEGNAYFGIHCYQEGCGIQIGDHKEFVKSYPNMEASVQDYMLFLNSEPGTEKFRSARQIYLKDKNLSTLVESLVGYSQIGGSYFGILNDLLENYIPENIDEY